MAASRNCDGSSLLDLDTGFVYSGSSIDLHQTLQGVRMSRSATVVEYSGPCSASVLSPSLALQVTSPLSLDHTEPNGYPKIAVEYTGIGSSTLTPRCHSARVLSPSLVIKVQSPLTRGHTPESSKGLAVPVEVLSSTPREGEKPKPELDSLPNLSLIDLMSPKWSPLSWKFSHSPNCSHTVSLLDLNPECRSTSLCLVEASFG